jgi:hypothetical protein
MEPFAQFADFGNLGKHKSVKSELFGNLEGPGFKGFPSKSGTFLTGKENNLNPDQGVFEIKSARIRSKLSTGRAWNEFGKEMPLSSMDASPHLKKPFPVSKGTGAFDVGKKATNPEMITGFGFLPNYPEEERIKELLNKPVVLGKESVFYKEQVAPKREEPMYEGLYDTHRDKYIEQKFNRLAKLGFSEEMIQEAIREEAKRDITKALQNPNLMKEAEMSSLIEETYERWVTARNSLKTGENAVGIGGGSSIQNPGVTAYNAAAAVASQTVPVVKTGAQRMRRELREVGSVGTVDPEDLVSEGGFGTGPGGSATLRRKKIPMIKEGQTTIKEFFGPKK